MENGPRVRKSKLGVLVGAVGEPERSKRVSLIEPALRQHPVRSTVANFGPPTTRQLTRTASQFNLPHSL